MVARMTEAGEIEATERFPTDPDFNQFAPTLIASLKKLATNDTTGVGIAVPGQVDYDNGTGIVFGNLPWKNVPIASAVQEAFELPVGIIVENDAKAAGLAEARALEPPRSNVVYITIGTGIGIAIIIDNKIDPHFRRSEAGFERFEHNGQLVIWESFASGKAIADRYGKKAADIPEGDPAWISIADDLALGIGNLIAVLAPEVIIIGGGVGKHLPKFQEPLEAALLKYKDRVVINLPQIRQAQHPEEAVLYGCYHLIKDKLSRV